MFERSASVTAFASSEMSEASEDGTEGAEAGAFSSSSHSSPESGVDSRKFVVLRVAASGARSAG